MIDKVIPYHMASHMELAAKLNEIIDAVNLLGDGPIPQSQQTKKSLAEVSKQIGELKDAVDNLVGGKGAKKKR